MTLILIILGFIAVALVVAAYLNVQKSKRLQQQPVKGNIVSQETSNDKLVIIKNVSPKLRRKVGEYYRIVDEFF